MFYNLKKSTYTAIEKYEILKQIRSIRNILYLVIITWISGSFLTIINEYLLSPVKNRTFDDYLNFFLLNIKVILTADFSDFEDLTFITLVISILMVVIGIVVIGMLTGQIISALMLVTEKNKYIPAKSPRFNFHNPIIICGINDRIFDVLKALRLNPLSKDREIIIIDEKSDKLELLGEDKKELIDVYYLKGNPADRKVLSKAINTKYKTNINSKSVPAIILSNHKSGKMSDQKAIETSLAMESFDESVYTIVEFQEQKYMGYLEKTKVDEMININEYDYKLLAQASLNLGITEVYNKLLQFNNISKTKESTSVIFNDLPISCEGKSYKEIKIFLYENHSSSNILFIGFKKSIKNMEINIDIEQYIDNNQNSSIVVINPIKQTKYMHGDLGVNKVDNLVYLTQDTILNNNDKLIFISNNKINFN